MEYRKIANPPSNKAMRRLIEEGNTRAMTARATYRYYLAIGLWSWLKMLQFHIPTDLKHYRDLYDPGDHPVANVLGPAWELAMDQYKSMTNCSERAAQREVLHTEAPLIYIGFKSMQMSDTPNWFIPTEDLLLSLLATDLDGLYPDDIRLPAPGMFIQLPRGILKSISDRGLHDVLAIGVSEGFVKGSGVGIGDNIVTFDHDDAIMGRRLLISLVREPLSDDRCGLEDASPLSFSIPINKPDKTLNELIDTEDSIMIALSKEFEARSKVRWGELCGSSVNKLELRNRVVSLVINILIYLTTEGHTKKRRGVKKQAAKKKSKNSLKSALATTDWLIGTEVKIEKGVRDALYQGKRRGTKKAKTFRRGHFYNQAHGPKHSLRRRRWRRPCIVNYDVEGAITGHQYKG